MKGFLITNGGGAPGQKALFSKTSRDCSFFRNLLVLDCFTLRCCSRSLALPHAQGWLCGGLVQSHPEMCGICRDMLHTFRNAMRKRHAQNKVYGSMGGFLGLLPFLGTASFQKNCIIAGRKLYCIGKHGNPFRWFL